MYESTDMINLTYFYDFLARQSCVDDFDLVFVVVHFSLFSVHEEQKIRLTGWKLSNISLFCSHQPGRGRKVNRLKVDKTP